MTPSQIQSIAERHLSEWCASPPGMERQPTLRRHFIEAMAEAATEERKAWQAGNGTLRHERDVAQNELAAVRAALSFDPAVDRDLESCARRLFHDRIDLQFAARGHRMAIDKLEEKVKANGRVEEV